MHNRIRPYAWGSRTAIAELLGAPSPSPHPQAELWVGAHPADMPQAVLQHPLLDRDLRACVQMLHRAAATGAGAESEVRAAGYCAQHGRALDRDDASDFIAGLVAAALVEHRLARQRAFDEDGLAIAMADAPAFLVE